MGGLRRTGALWALLSQVGWAGPLPGKVLRWASLSLQSRTAAVPAAAFSFRIQVLVPLPNSSVPVCLPASFPLRYSGAEAWPARRARRRSGQLLARTRLCREGWRDGGEMNTVLTRANSLFAFSLSVMAALTFGCFITTAFKERSVPVSIAVSRVML